MAIRYNLDYKVVASALLSRISTKQKQIDPSSLPKSPSNIFLSIVFK